MPPPWDSSLPLPGREVAYSSDDPDALSLATKAS
jgi:hypothetical protein